MKHEDLVRSVARETRQTPAEASDEIDALVHKILRSLRLGEPVELPGVGKLISSGRRSPKSGGRRKPR